MKILRCKDVSKKTGLPTSTIYAMVKEKLFPVPIHLGPRTTGWIEDEVEEWLNEKVQQRNMDALTA